MDNKKNAFTANLTKKEIKGIARLKKEILNLVPDAKIILYGSKAKGKSDSESDIDLLIIIPGLTKVLKYKIIEIATEIELKYDIVFGLVIISDEKYKRSAVFKGSLYYKNVRNEGLLI